MRVFGLSVLCFGWAHLASAQIATTIETTLPSPSALEDSTKTNWDVCNETSYVLRYASSFIRNDRMQTAGWTNIQPGACSTLVTPKDGVNAEIAGLQRLLQDSGYKITRVDGLSGRRTLRTITRAKSDLKLDKSATNQELITALIPKVQEARNSIGLDICGEALPDRRLRSELVTPAPFCIAESRFAALGRENCLEKGYAAVDFRPVASDVDVQIIRLTDADFVTDGGDGLRR